MTPRHRLTASLGAAAAGALLAGSAAADPLRLGHSTWVGYGPFYIAEEMGFFEEEGVEVTLQIVEDTSSRMTALAAGQLDAVATTMDTMQLYLTEDAPLVYVFAVDDSTGGDGLVSNADITSIEELAGHSVAYSSGSVSEFYITYLLQEAGLSVDDIDHTDMGQADAGAAFVAERVDAAVTWEPWLTRARDTEHGHVLADSSENPGLIVDIILAAPDVLEERLDEFRALYRAWNRAVGYWEENPDEANAIMAAGVGGWLDEVDVFAETLEGVRYYDAARNEEFWGTPDAPGAIIDTVGAALDIWEANDRLRVEADPMDLISYDVVGQ